jgi:hypothetical protein
MRPSGTIQETTAQQVKDDGTDKFRDLIKKAMGGVLFIDEAYDLDPSGDFKGKPIFSELLTASENYRDKISFILAGYQDDMQSKLFSYNDGLASRFEEIMFDDFDESELRKVWEGILEEKSWIASEEVSSLVCKRLARQSGKKGFGNAREVRRMAEKAIQAAMSSEDWTGARMELFTVHILGERPAQNPKLQPLLDELNRKTGWATIKEAVRNLIELAETNYDRELNGLAPVPVSYHKIFLGNPGTGKPLRNFFLTFFRKDHVRQLVRQIIENSERAFRRRCSQQDCQRLCGKRGGREPDEDEHHLESLSRKSPGHR